MTVAFPEPGDLVKTVVDLVTAANGGTDTIDGVTVSGVPAVNDVIKATSATTATWQAGGGGGGGFSDLLSISNDGSFATFPDSAPQKIGWDPTAVGGALYRTNGTAISWNITDPTRLTINTTGYYDIDASLAVSNSSAPGIYGFGLVYVNGVPSNYTLPSQIYIPQDVSVTAIQVRLKRIALSATDYVEVAGLIVGDATVSPQELLVVATRVA